jgi:N-acyl-D-amino-acid deacylase
MTHRRPRRRFLGASARAAAGLALGGRALRLEAQPAFDIVIRGADVLDGTGAPRYSADVGIRGDSIAAIGSLPADAASRAIDARGQCLAPGFIDIHSHSDGDILVYPGAESRVRQGVTTEITGNCGSSRAPLAGQDVERRRKEWLDEDGLTANWTDVASYAAAIEASGAAINQALLLGQGTLRANAVGLVNRPLTEDELAGVLGVLEAGLDQGALGLSTGLEYTPGRFTPTEEIVRMARLVARRGGLYASHVRNEEAGLLEAVHEAIDIGRRSGARVEVSHLKAAGRINWSKQEAALHLIESARREGIGVWADAYPYAAYSTGLTILLDDWALEGGRPAMLERLKDAALRPRIRKEVAAKVKDEPGGYELIVISSVKTERNRGMVGKNFQEIAERWRMEPIDALLRLLEEEEGAVGFIGHGMSAANVDAVLAHPLVMIGSDGRSMAPVGKAAERRPHPRSYGAFARVLGVYVRERKLFDLETAVKKMTSLPADQAGLADRGRIASGKKADLVVFDPATVADAATFDAPHRYPTGIRYVLVNGVVVIDDGKQTEARPGRMLRRA